jgi:hypothetical protein
MQLPVIRKGVSAAARGCALQSACKPGAETDGLAHLPESIRAKVQDHPCYSEQAHHYFARMHVAVAPLPKVRRDLSRSPSRSRKYPPQISGVSAATLMTLSSNESSTLACVSIAVKDVDSIRTIELKVVCWKVP